MRLLIVPLLLLSVEAKESVLQAQKGLKEVRGGIKMTKKRPTFWSDFGIEVDSRGKVRQVFSEISFEKLGKRSMFKSSMKPKKLRFPVRFKR